MKNVIALFLLTGGLAYPQDQQPAAKAAEKFDFKARFAWYAKRTYTNLWGHANLIGEVTVDDFAFGDVKRWGTGLSGWGKSLAPVYGQRVVDNTTEFLLGALVGDDARYRPSEKRGIVRRGLHATVDAFTARAKSGNTRPAYSRIIAVTTGILIANQWRSKPETGYTLSRALAFGVTDKIQGDLLQEFTPDLKHMGNKIWRKIRRDH
jgi:hypothetical protein